MWCDGVWCGVVWCGVVWCGEVWCGVVWCGVGSCGVVWCGVVCADVLSTPTFWTVWLPSTGDMIWLAEQCHAVSVTTKRDKIVVNFIPSASCSVTDRHCWQ